MKIDPDLNAIAQPYAEKLGATNALVHSGNKKDGKWMGENLYMKVGRPAPMLSGGEACMSWYNEIDVYDFTTGDMKAGTPSDKMIGHFTQLVWPTSTQLGLGVGCSTKGGVYVVGNYFPGGNMRGKNLQNVPKLLSSG